MMYITWSDKWRGKTRLNTQISPLTGIQNNTWPLTFLSWYRNFNKIDGIKLDLVLKFPSYRHDAAMKVFSTCEFITKSITHVLFCMPVRGEIWVLSLVLPRHFLLKFLYQDRKVSGHVLFCMSVRGRFEYLYEIKWTKQTKLSE
jgi:hypothetical protein